MDVRADDIAGAVYLREGVHGVTVGDDLALLDLDADGYFCVPGGKQAVGLSAKGHILLMPGDVAAVVTAAGLTGSTKGPVAKAIPPLPTRTIIHDKAEPVSFVQILRGFSVVRDLKRAQRGRGLRPMLSVADGPLTPACNGSAIQEAKAFWRIAPWLPVEGECLVRSAMLMSFLRRSKVSADWVFGVRLWPFSAHCWVQAGDTCLNDDLERLAAYTPVFCR